MSNQRKYYLFLLALFIIPVVLFASNAKAEKKITGAFGFRFGEQLNAALMKNTTPDEHGLARNEVDPKEPSPHFEMYSVSIIPGTRQIAMVTATKTIKNDRDKAHKFFISQKQEMSNRFGNPHSSSESIAAWKIGGVEVVLLNTEVKDKSNPMSIILVLYSDDAMVDLASKQGKK